MTEGRYLDFPYSMDRDDEFAGMVYNRQHGFWHTVPDDEVVICQRCSKPSIDPIDDEICDGCISIEVYEEEERERKAEEALYRDRIARKLCVQCGRQTPIRDYRCKRCIEHNEQEHEEWLQESWGNEQWKAALRLVEHVRKHHGVWRRRKRRHFTRPVQLFRTIWHRVPFYYRVRPHIHPRDLPHLVYPDQMGGLGKMRQRARRRCRERWWEGYWEDLSIWNGQEWEQVSRAVDNRPTPASGTVKVLRIWKYIEHTGQMDNDENLPF